MSPDAYWLASPGGGAILQSELLSNIIEFRVKVESIGAEAEFEEFVHPLAVVMTQDCELDLDHKARQDGTPQRLIENVLFCEADDASAMRTRDGINNSRWRQIESHQTERYQTLRSPPAAVADGGLPPVAGGADGPPVGPVPIAPWRQWFKGFLPVRVPPPAAEGAALVYEAPPAPFRGTIGLDFRRVFTIPMPELLRRIEIGEARRHCYLSPVYRDHLSNRFYGYHMRVALEEQQQ